MPLASSLTVSTTRDLAMDASRSTAQSTTSAWRDSSASRGSYALGLMAAIWGVPLHDTVAMALPPYTGRVASNLPDSFIRTSRQSWARPVDSLKARRGAKSRPDAVRPISSTAGATSLARLSRAARYRSGWYSPSRGWATA